MNTDSESNYSHSDVTGMNTDSESNYSHSDVTGMTAELLAAMADLKMTMQSELNNSISNLKEELKEENTKNTHELRKEISDMKVFMLAEIEKSKSELRKEFEEKFKSNSTSSKTEKKLKWMAIDSEARGRRSNMVFFGIEESDGEVCEDKIHHFLKTKMKITESVNIQRAHRLGAEKKGTVVGAKAGRPRPIIVCFHDFKQKEMVRAKKVDLERGFGVSEDFPRAIRNARASLLDELKELKRSKKKAAIIWPARLLADGEIVRVADPVDFFDA